MSRHQECHSQKRYSDGLARLKCSDMGRLADSGTCLSGSTRSTIGCFGQSDGPPTPMMILPEKSQTIAAPKQVLVSKHRKTPESKSDTLCARNRCERFFASSKWEENHEILYSVGDHHCMRSHVHCAGSGWRTSDDGPGRHQSLFHFP